MMPPTTPSGSPFAASEATQSAERQTAVTFSAPPPATQQQATGLYRLPASSTMSTERYAGRQSSWPPSTDSPAPRRSPALTPPDLAIAPLGQSASQQNSVASAYSSDSHQTNRSHRYPPESSEAARID